MLNKKLASVGLNIIKYWLYYNFLGVLFGTFGMYIVLYVVLKAAMTDGRKNILMSCMLCKHDICGTKSTAKLHTEFKVFYKLLPYTPKFTLHRIVVFKLKFCV